MLQSSTSTRQAAGVLGNVLNYLTKPDAPGWLSMVYRVWQRETRDDIDLNADPGDRPHPGQDCPRRGLPVACAPGGRDWLNEDPEAAALTEADPLAADELAAFRELVRRWQNAAVLPIDQLLLVLAGDLFWQRGRPGPGAQSGRRVAQLRRPPAGLASAAIHRRTGLHRPQSAPLPGHG